MLTHNDFEDALMKFLRSAKPKQDRDRKRRILWGRVMQIALDLETTHDR